MSEIVFMASPFQVRAIRESDRFAFRFSLLHQETWIPILESVETSSAQSAPASPPIQQVVLESMSSDRQALLGVGMSDGAHWSLSIHSEPLNHLCIDVACRLRKGVDWLGSTLQLDRSWSFECSSDVRDSSGHFKCIHAPGLILRVVTKSDLVFQDADHALVITPPTSKETFPRTVRWQWSLQA